MTTQMNDNLMNRNLSNSEQSFPEGSPDYNTKSLYLYMPNINIISWFDKSTIKHLRLHFSYHLMPVFLFALSQSNGINWNHTIIAFLILHLLIYPSSNGYNSYQDK